MTTPTKPPAGALPLAHLEHVHAQARASGLPVAFLLMPAHDVGDLRTQTLSLLGVRTVETGPFSSARAYREGMDEGFVRFKGLPVHVGTVYGWGCHA
jgi:hypothetical protein